VTRAVLRVCDENLLVGRRQVPELLRDGPRAVPVEDEEAVALRLERPLDPRERLGGGPLEKSARLGIEGAAEFVVLRRVADVEQDRGVERHELDEIRRAEGAVFLRRDVLRRERPGWEEQEGESRKKPQRNLQRTPHRPIPHLCRLDHRNATKEPIPMKEYT
jgi:hypothetical protein